MRSSPPTPRPGAICHHTTHHHRDDTATAVPRALSWRQPRARYRGLRREGNQAGGWGERDLGIQAGRKLILICRIDGKSNIKQYHYITKQNRQNNSQISLSIQIFKDKPFNHRNFKTEFDGRHHFNIAKGAKRPCV